MTLSDWKHLRVHLGRIPDDLGRLMRKQGWRLVMEDSVWVWTKPVMCGHQIGSPTNATTSAKPAGEAERRHVHGLVYDFVDINSRVPKEHRKWKDEGADG